MSSSREVSPALLFEMKEWKQYVDATFGKTRDDINSEHVMFYTVYVDSPVGNGSVAAIVVAAHTHTNTSVVWLCDAVCRNSTDFKHFVKNNVEACRSVFDPHQTKRCWFFVDSTVGYTAHDIEDLSLKSGWRKCTHYCSTEESRVGVVMNKRIKHDAFVVFYESIRDGRVLIDKSNAQGVVDKLYHQLTGFTDSKSVNYSTPSDDSLAIAFIMSRSCIWLVLSH